MDPQPTPRPAPAGPADGGPAAARAELTRMLGRVRLPGFPKAHGHILAGLRDERCSPRDLAERVAMDPAVSVKLLRVVNSAAYALRSQVRSIPHAIAMVGRRPMENLVLSLGVKGALPRWPARFFDAKAFWRASARRATTARALAERFEPDQAELAFTAALLLDMAVPLLVKARPRTYAELLADAAAGEDSLAALERQAFGFDHAEVGALLAEAWDFPVALRLAIADHHAGATLGSPVSVRLAAQLGDERDDRLDLDPLMGLACQRFGLAPALVRSAVDTGLRRAADLAACLG